MEEGVTEEINELNIGGLAEILQEDKGCQPAGLVITEAWK